MSKRKGKGKGKTARIEIPDPVRENFARVLRARNLVQAGPPSPPPPWETVSISRDRIELVDFLLDLRIRNASILTAPLSTLATATHTLRSRVDPDVHDRALTEISRLRKEIASYEQSGDGRAQVVDRLRAERDELRAKIADYQDADARSGQEIAALERARTDLLLTWDPLLEEFYDPRDYETRRPAGGYPVYQVIAGHLAVTLGEAIGYDGDGPRHLLQLRDDRLGRARWFPDRIVYATEETLDRRAELPQILDEPPEAERSDPDPTLETSSYILPVLGDSGASGGIEDWDPHGIYPAPVDDQFVRNMKTILAEERDPLDVRIPEEGQLWGIPVTIETGASRRTSIEADQETAEDLDNSGDPVAALADYLDEEDLDAAAFPEDLVDRALYDQALRELDDKTALANMPGVDAAAIILDRIASIQLRIVDPDYDRLSDQILDDNRSIEAGE